MNEKIHLAMKKVNDIIDQNPKTLSTEQFETIKENIEIVIKYVSDEIDETPENVKLVE